MDPGFTQKLDEVSGCKLPDSLKNNISKLIQTYCFNCGVSVNLDVNHVGAMPDVLKSAFCKLLNHAYSIDSRTEKLVLDLLKLICHAFDDEDSGHNSPQANCVGDDERINISPDSKSENLGNSDAHNVVHFSQYEVSKANNPSSPICHSSLGQPNCSPSGTSDTAHDACKPSAPLLVPQLNRSTTKILPPNVDNEDVARVLQKLTNNKSSIPPPSQKTPSKFVFPPSGYPSH